jgi:hypothetical protein
MKERTKKKLDTHFVGHLKKSFVSSEAAKAPKNSFGYLLHDRSSSSLEYTVSSSGFGRSNTS